MRTQSLKHLGLLVCASAQAVVDTALFAANSTTSCFRFQSHSSPPANFTTFEALTIQGDLISGSIRLQAVPDAGSTWLLTTMSSLALVALRRNLSLQA